VNGGSLRGYESEMQQNGKRKRENGKKEMQQKPKMV